MGNTFAGCIIIRPVIVIREVIWKIIIDTGSKTIGKLVSQERKIAGVEIWIAYSSGFRYLQFISHFVNCFDVKVVVVQGSLVVADNVFNTYCVALPTSLCVQLS